MISLATFEEMQGKIFSDVNRINRLEGLLKEVNDFQDLIFDDATYKDVPSSNIDALIMPLENLTAKIEVLIRDAKKDANEHNQILLKYIFSDDKN